MNITVVEQVSSALSVATLRNQVIASNIAHRDTQGYQRLKLRFDEALAAPAFGTGAPAAAAKPVVAVDASGARPSLEEDMVALSTNTLNYQALARALSRYFSIAETIANGGRS
jgi:flagellar basal-body rod protein FlgB